MILILDLLVGKEASLSVRPYQYASYTAFFVSERRRWRNEARKLAHRDSTGSQLHKSDMRVTAVFDGDFNGGQASGN